MSSECTRYRVRLQPQGLQTASLEPIMSTVTQDETQRLLRDLRAWCDGRRGRRVEIARALGTSRQQIGNWLSGRVSPGVRWHFKIRRFLDERKSLDSIR